ncbi:MAG: hypothetical protein IPH48_20575 [bacterium]|jgi:hypothetical protein|nr:hypothetical protein [bacterium]MBK9776287.1 hypothetical protein [bacterium]
MMSHLSPWLVALTAFALVFAALGLLAVLLFTLRALAVRSARRKAGADAAPAVDGLDEEALAVLAASAWMALGAPVRIHRVHVHGEPAGQAWERAGRMDIMVSHRVGHK